MIRFFKALAVCLSMFSVAHAQGGFSPYSILGLGDLHENSSVNLQGMGGIGYSYGNTFFFNPKNPAHLALNKMTVFNAGFFGEFKYLRQNDKANIAAGANSTSANLSFPIHKKLTMAVGLKPMSTVNYSFSFSKHLQGTDAFGLYNYKGSGGINQAYTSFGLSVYKGFSLGFTAHYNFGVIDKESKVLINDPTQATNSQGEYIIDLFQRDWYSELSYQTGFAWKIKLQEKKYLNFGGVYSPSVNFSAQRTTALERRTLTEITVEADTLADVINPQQIPASFGAGVSYQVLNKFVVGVDYSFADWSVFKATATEPTGLLGRSSKWSAGLEYTPDLASVSSYFKRMTYRVGGFYQEQAVLSNGTPSLHVGINFGGSLPVGKNLSTLNYAFTLGRKGAFDSSSVREDYVRFHLGMTINERWFLRRKIN